MLKTPIKKQIKKNYRIKPQPSFEERENLKARAYKFTNQTNLAKVFKTSIQNINAAFVGRNPSLMNKVKNYIEKFEQRNNSIQEDQLIGEDRYRNEQ